MTKTLDAVKSGRVEVQEITGGRNAVQQLAQRGIRPNQVLEVRHTAPMGGPIMVEVDGCSVAIGRGLARDILVRVD